MKINLKILIAFLSCLVIVLVFIVGYEFGLNKQKYEGIKIKLEEVQKGTEALTMVHSLHEGLVAFVRKNGFQEINFLGTNTKSSLGVDLSQLDCNIEDEPSLCCSENFCYEVALTTSGGAIYASRKENTKGVFYMFDEHFGKHVDTNFKECLYAKNDELGKNICSEFKKFGWNYSMMGN